MNNSPLLNHYQAWLDDFTRVSLFHGLCQQHIIQWHRLAITASLMPDGSVTECVIPQCLLPVTRTDQLGSCSAIQTHRLFPSTRRAAQRMLPAGEKPAGRTIAVVIPPVPTARYT